MEIDPYPMFVREGNPKRRKKLGESLALGVLPESVTRPSTRGRVAFPTKAQSNVDKSMGNNPGACVAKLQRPFRSLVVRSVFFDQGFTSQRTNQRSSTYTISPEMEAKELVGFGVYLVAP